VLTTITIEPIAIQNQIFFIQTRFYRKDDVTGQWLRYQKEDVHSVTWPTIASTQGYY